VIKLESIIQQLTSACARRAQPHLISKFVRSSWISSFIAFRLNSAVQSYFNWAYLSYLAWWCFLTPA